MSGVQIKNQAIVAEGLPTPFIDDRDDWKPVRSDRYGGLHISQADSSMLNYLAEGTMLTALSGTVGTGLTGVTAQVVFNDTGPALYIYNPEPPKAEGGKTIYVQWLKMIATATATSTTSQHYAVVVDPVLRLITTDNFSLLTVNNPVPNRAPIASPIVKFQNNATVSAIAASTSQKKVIGRGTLGALNIVGDELIVVFGRGDIQAHAGLTAAQVGQTSKRVSHAPGFPIPPGSTGTVHCWGLAQAAAYSPEVEVCMIAR